MIRGSARTVGYTILALSMSACVTTSYTEYGGANDAETPPDRRVAYYVDKALYTDPPECVVVAAVESADATRLAANVESALARHLMMKVPRVIDARGRRRLERDLALDLSDTGDRRRFARTTGCGYFLTARIEAGEDYIVVWAARRVGIEAALVRAADGVAVWKASHAATRSDGGLPLSPFSAPIAAFEATMFHEDAEIVLSMVDDVVRRLFVTLPELR